MAIKGPPAKGTKHGHSSTVDWTDVPDVPFADGRALPRRPKTGPRAWRPEVVDWWDELSRMPHCVLWRPPDWQFALETAAMKQQFWVDLDEGEFKSTLATEIRRREDLMGVTSEARRKLRIRYVNPNETEPASDQADGDGVQDDQAAVDELAERRRRILEAG